MRYRWIGPNIHIVFSTKTEAEAAAARWGGTVVPVPPSD